MIYGKGLALLFAFLAAGFLSLRKRTALSRLEKQLMNADLKPLWIERLEYKYHAQRFLCFSLGLLMNALFLAAEKNFDRLTFVATVVVCGISIVGTVITTVEFYVFKELTMTQEERNKKEFKNTIGRSL